MRHAPRRAAVLPVHDVEAVMHVPEHGLHEQERDDDGAEDRVAVAGGPGARDGGHPGAEAEGGEREGGGEELQGGVVSDFVFGWEEADEEDAEGEEEHEDETHEGGMDDDDAVEGRGGSRFGLFCLLLGGG